MRPCASLSVLLHESGGPPRLFGVQSCSDAMQRTCLQAKYQRQITAAMTPLRNGKLRDRPCQACCVPASSGRPSTSRTEDRLEHRQSGRRARRRITCCCSLSTRLFQISSSICSSKRSMLRSHKLKDAFGNGRVLEVDYSLETNRACTLCIVDFATCVVSARA